MHTYNKGYTGWKVAFLYCLCGWSACYGFPPKSYIRKYTLKIVLRYKMCQKWPDLALRSMNYVRASVQYKVDLMHSREKESTVNFGKCYFHAWWYYINIMLELAPDLLKPLITDLSLLFGLNTAKEITVIKVVRFVASLYVRLQIWQFRISCLVQNPVYPGNLLVYRKIYYIRSTPH